MPLNTLCLDNSYESIKKCADIIKTGGLVAFPTETVYGLGASAFNKQSIAKIYEAKGRPTDNPLIVHVDSVEKIYPLVLDVPKKAQILIDEFMPGAITLILFKTDLIPDEITNFKKTVGIRVPSNETARLFIETCNVPICAPSANLSGKPSTTSANHVIDDLNGKIDAIIIDNPSEFGLESTIIDMTTDIPTLLRPGSITVSMIESVIGPIEISSYIKDNLFVDDDTAPIAPGMKYKHYSPKAPITIFKGSDDLVIKQIENLSSINNDEKHLKVGILTNDQNKDKFDKNKYTILTLGNNIKDYGKNLFSVLRKFDDEKVDIIYSFSFDDLDGESMALMNRLKKASGFNIVTL